MPFDIVRGKITKPEQSNQLIAAVKEYMEKNTTDGTLYLGYPLTKEWLHLFLEIHRIL